MIGIHKRFSKQLFNQNDPKSRKVVKDYLAKQGIIVCDNADKYGVDLISEDKTLQVEVEHRNVWTEEIFPFSEINLPERKAKFFVEHKIAYFILSANYSRVGMIDGKTLMRYIVDENLKESSNKFVRNGEFFYKLPKDAFKWDKT